MSGRTEWEEDCLAYRGEVLTGKRAHFCLDFDGLPVDDTTWEALVCHCYDGDPEQRTEEEIAAIRAAHPLGAVEAF